MGTNTRGIEVSKGENAETDPIFPSVSVFTIASPLAMGRACPSCGLSEVKRKIMCSLARVLLDMLMSLRKEVSNQAHLCVALELQHPALLCCPKAERKHWVLQENTKEKAARGRKSNA